VLAVQSDGAKPSDDARLRVDDLVDAADRNLAEHQFLLAFLAADGEVDVRLVLRLDVEHRDDGVVGVERPAARADEQSYSRYSFKNADFEFYKHPPAAAYKLNKLLFDVRHDSGLRLRLLNDLDGVAQEWGLNDEEKEATQAIASVGGNSKISDSAAALVKAGAHPLQALMSLHAVHGEFTRLQQEAAKRK